MVGEYVCPDMEQGLVRSHRSEDLQDDVGG